MNVCTACSGTSRQSCRGVSEPEESVARTSNAREAISPVTVVEEAARSPAPLAMVGVATRKLSGTVESRKFHAALAQVGGHAATTVMVRGIDSAPLATGTVWLLARPAAVHRR